MDAFPNRKGSGNKATTYSAGPYISAGPRASDLKQVRLPKQRQTFRRLWGIQIPKSLKSKPHSLTNRKGHWYKTAIRGHVHPFSFLGSESPTTGALTPRSNSNPSTRPGAGPDLPPGGPSRMAAHRGVSKRVPFGFNVKSTTKEIPKKTPICAAGRKDKLVRKTGRMNKNPHPTKIKRGKLQIADRY